MKNLLKNAFLDAEKLLVGFYNDQDNLERLSTVASAMAQCFQQGGKILICGNGGSFCDAAHFAEEFTGRYRKDRRPLPAIALGDGGHITCVANDYSFNDIFSRNVEAFGKPNDWFIGLSTSGNSQNVINALLCAKKLQLHTLALLGKDGGKMLGLAHHEFIIPGKTADRIQELHMTILHILIEGIERIMFSDDYK